MSDETSMQRLRIKVDREDAGFVPGEPITGRVAWDLAEGPEQVTVRLFWQTSGKGTQDTGIVEEHVWQGAALRESRDFSFAGVEGPYSFSGKLITVSWIVEAIVEPTGEHAEVSLTLSPTGEEVRL